MRCAFLMIIAGAQAFGGLTEGSDGEKGRKIAFEAMELCEKKLTHTLGSEWFGCVADTLTERQEAAMTAGSSDYYPIVPHQLSPWQPEVMPKGGGSVGHFKSEELKNCARLEAQPLHGHLGAIAHRRVRAACRDA